MTTKTIEQRLQEVEDRVAIKSIVDTFSNLADKKDMASVVQLLTEDADVEFYFGAALAGSWKGRAEFERAMTGAGASFDSTHHINGHQVIEVEGDTASSELYCLAIQIASAGGKKTLTTNGVTYSDTLVRQGDGWKISKRVSRFGWSDTSEMLAA